MSGTTNHEEAVADAEDSKFFFSLQADDNGVTELKFRKEADRVFGTILFTLDYINQSFDVPYPTVSEFISQLSELAKYMEAKHAAQATNDGGDNQPEAANDEEGTPSPDAA